jgi:hypothetical protein
MKNTKILFAVLALICAATIATAADPLGLNLPTSTVTLTIPGLAGNTAQIYIKLANVPAGYDVTNGQYLGWCADPDNIIYYPNVPYNARLYSSYDNALPQNAASANWPKINYLVNKYRKGGFSGTCATAVRDDEIQTIIWSFLGHSNVWGTPSTACMTAIKADVNANGASYVPASGDVVGIVADNGRYVQVVFLELPYVTAPEIAGLAMAIAMISPAFGYLLVKKRK